MTSLTTCTTTLATATTPINTTTTTTIPITIIIARNKIMYLSVQIYSYLYAHSGTHSTAAILGIFKTIEGRLVLTQQVTKCKKHVSLKFQHLTLCFLPRTLLGQKNHPVSTSVTDDCYYKGQL